jgi:hypothetical protein
VNSFIPGFMRTLLLLSLFGLLSPLSRAVGSTFVVVHMADESVVSGQLVSVSDRGVELQVNDAGSSPHRRTIALSEIGRVAFREPTTMPSGPRATNGAPAARGAGDAAAWETALQFFFGPKDNADAASKPARNEVRGQAATSQPTSKAVARAPIDRTAWALHLVDDDLLHGRVVEWSANALHLKLNLPGGPIIELPRNELSQVWCGSPAEVLKARGLNPDRGPDDVAFAVNDSEIVAVRGKAVGIDGESLRFQFDGAERRISLDRLVGVMIGTSDQLPPDPTFHQAARIDSGDVLSGTWTGFDGKAVSMRTSWGSIVEVPTEAVSGIDCVNGRVVYLSDLKPATVEQTPFFGKVIPFRNDVSLDGGPIKLSDGEYKKGVCVHSRCVLTYTLDGRFQRFRAKLGFEQPAGRQGRVAARVRGTEKVLYENLDARGDQPPAELDLDLAGQQTLTLEVDFGKDQDVGDRVVWANARLLRTDLPQQGAK